MLKIGCIFFCSSPRTQVLMLKSIVIVENLIKETKNGLVDFHIKT